jgi:hypothetical protein
MITGFDHFIIAVNDLGTAMEKYRALGFEVRAGGEHIAFGSHNALVALGDGSYIELLAFKDPGLAEKTFWSDAVRKWRVREGFIGFVLASDNLAGDVVQCRERKLNIADAKPGSRMRPDGQRVAWYTALIDEMPSGAMPFLIQDDTPRALRIEPASQGLGSYMHPHEIVVLADHADLIRNEYQVLLGTELRRVHNTEGDVTGYRVTMKWGSIVIAHPDTDGNAMADQLGQRGEGLFAITFVSDDINKARQEMKKRNIPVDDEKFGFVIKPEAACGARLRFTQP